MSTLTSRTLLAIEMLLLGVPILPIYFTIAFSWLEDAVNPTRSSGHFGIVLIIFLGLFLLAAYRVAFAFVYKGHKALRTLHEGWWWLGLGGAAYAVLAVLLVILGGRLGNMLDSGFKMTGTFGALYLVPLTHVLLEKNLRKVQPHAA